MIDLWGNVDPHVQHSIELLKEHEPDGKYYLAFSGGKDSIVIEHLAKISGVKYEAHFQRAMEPPELIYFIRKHYPNVIRHLPKKTMWQLIEDNGIPPLRTIRYCCRVLKEFAGSGGTVITGVRKRESFARSKYKEFTIMKDKIVVCPIFHWSTEEVWGYIRNNNLPYPCLYDEGFTRLGCVMCPNSGTKGMKRDALRWPKIASAYKRACIRAFDPDIARVWTSGEDMYNFWISGQGFGPEPTLWDESEV